MNGVKPKKERRLTAIFRQSDAAHCGGINSLLVSQDGQSLFSASRDATVKQWDITRGQPRLLQSFEEHVDWVNDIALAGSFLLTCSSDKTVKVWRSDGACVHTSASHSDCAMALAAAPDAQCAFSAGALLFNSQKPTVLCGTSALTGSVLCLPLLFPTLKLMRW